MTRSKDNNALEWSSIYLTVNRCFSELDHHHHLSRGVGEDRTVGGGGGQVFQTVQQKRRKKSALPKGGVEDIK